MISEYTPSNPITAFDILTGGQFVVVASSDSSYPTVLQLRGPSVINPDSQKTIYNDGPLEVDLSLDFREDARWQPNVKNIFGDILKNLYSVGVIVSKHTMCIRFYCFPIVKMFAFSLSLFT